MCVINYELLISQLKRVVGAQKNCHNETDVLSTQNKCLNV